jgi:hypothetical protein
MSWDEQVDYMRDCDILAGLADELAGITLATLPTVPEGKYGATFCGMWRQADGSYEGDPADN